MRASLLVHPALLVERLADKVQQRRRLKRLKGTVAEGLVRGHIDSLELLDIATRLRPNVIYDVGANVGTWARLARARFPQAHIHAFEPLRHHLAGFQASAVGADPRVTLHPIALGTTSEDKPLLVTSFSDASSFLPLTNDNRTLYDLEVVSEESVPVAPMDIYVAAQRLPYPDLIKADVQGFELEVFRGGAQCLAHTKAIICEVSFLELYAGQPLFHDIVGFLAERGFGVAAFSITTDLGFPLKQADVLFVARSHFPQLHGGGAAA